MVGSVLRSRLNTSSADYEENLAAMQALWDEVAAEMATVPSVGGMAGLALITWSASFVFVEM